MLVMSFLVNWHCKSAAGRAMENDETSRFASSVMSLLLADGVDNGGERTISQPRSAKSSMIGSEERESIGSSMMTRARSVKKTTRMNFIRRGTEARWTPADSI